MGRRRPPLRSIAACATLPRVPQERAKVALQLKHLITPEGMGENFQVLIGGVGMESKKTAALSGLSFGRSSQFLVLGSQ